MENPFGIEASINYLDPASLQATLSISNRADASGKLLPQTVCIRNRRTVAPPAKLDIEGFEIRRQAPMAVDTGGSRAAAVRFRREAEQLIADITGARDVVAEPLGTMRSELREQHPRSRAHGPYMRFIHADFSDASAVQAIQHAFTHSGIAFSPQRRHAIYTVWRPLTPPPQDFPLALCDTRSVSREDERSLELVLDVPGTPRRTLQVTAYLMNGGHEWYYFQDMTVDEVVIFKGFDSDESHPKRVPHTAFADPRCGAEAASRRSVDIRVFACY
jgi:hypothetical protein